MKVALSLSCQHPPGTNMRDHLSQHLRQAALAAELGFAGVFSFEHFLLPAHQMLHQTTFLGRVAAEVPGLDVGTGISLAALHNPVELADAAATLDVITGGRFVFGVGLGYRDAEFAAFDVPKAKAGAIFEQRVQLIRRLWAEDEVTQQGYGFRLEGARCTLKPVQRPHPPIWVAANSNAGVRRAARLGDAWLLNPHARMRTLETQLDLYRAALRAEGRSLPEVLPMSREVFVAEDENGAWELARPHLEAKYRSYVEWGQDKVMPANEALALPFEELARDRFLVGTPDQVTNQLLSCRDRLGVNYVIVRLQWSGMDPDIADRAIRLLGTEVLPQLATSSR
jgi:alkanesulfonate monooxygenase SsuD/methylene tetrahydromethanopterin reductase-like flavin-dependent oxidoreductase (luciferase family)